MRREGSAEKLEMAIKLGLKVELEGYSYRMLRSTVVELEDQAALKPLKLVAVAARGGRTENRGLASGHTAPPKD